MREQRPPTFLARLGLRPAFGEKPLILITAPPSASLRLIRYRRVLVATSPAGLRPRPPPDAAAVRFVRLRRARHEVPSPGRPSHRFCPAPASGIFHLWPILAGCVSQRLARRRPIGPAVLPSVCGAFTMFSLVPVCGPATIANQRLQSSRWEYYEYYEYCASGGGAA